MTDHPALLVEQNGPICTLTLNRPRQRNALTAALINDLKDAISKIALQTSVHVIIIAASGSAFCAGHDLGELKAHAQDQDRGKAFYQELFQSCSALMLAITKCPKPIIAQVQGIATAAGCQLVATCDLAVAAKEARFATPGVHIGLFCSTPMVALTRAIGRKKSMEMLVTGDAISAEEAQQYGLINKAVEPEKLEETVLQLADKIAGKSPLTLAIGKTAFHEQINQSLPDAYDAACEVMTANMLIQDAAEGIDAFLAKRPPVWRGI